MVENIETRVTRLEEHMKQTAKDTADNKTLLKDIQTHVVALDSNTAAIKFGWKVLATIGAIFLSLAGIILGVLKWLN